MGRKRKHAKETNKIRCNNYSLPKRIRDDKSFKMIRLQENCRFSYANKGVEEWLPLLWGKTSVTFRRNSSRSKILES